MISEEQFNTIIARAKEYAHTSMAYVDYEDCKDAELLHMGEDFILLWNRGLPPLPGGVSPLPGGVPPLPRAMAATKNSDTPPPQSKNSALLQSKSSALLWFAANDFEALAARISTLPGQLRLHFVPRQYAPLLARQGFTEWGEYTDYFNPDINATLSQLGPIEEPEYLRPEECGAVSALSRRCALQSRGFEGESPEWFARWLAENSVLLRRVEGAVAGFCCVSIYSKGTIVWVREIAVDPAHQGKGLGKRLMEQALLYGSRQGAVKGFLAADVLNQNAIGLYEKYGFRAKGADSELQMVR